MPEVVVFVWSIARGMCQCSSGLAKTPDVDGFRKVPDRLLECDSNLSFGDPDAENLHVEGDSLKSPKAFCRGTGVTDNENWGYNDSVNDLRIRKWISQVVSKEAEYRCRDDMWIYTIYPQNIERMAQTGFALRTSPAQFILDFIVQQNDSPIASIECKNGELASHQEKQKEKDIGEPWTMGSEQGHRFARAVTRKRRESEAVLALEERE